MELQCHCGNIHITTDHTPEILTTCNCSICNRYGSKWGYFKPSEVNVKATGGELKPYVWGDKMIKFMHCTNCGCLTHYEGTDPNSDRVAVNFRMTDHKAIADIPERHFDGADSWEFIE